MSDTMTGLLDLPDAALREVGSWCPNLSTASALHSTCRALRWLRRDPAASALLLVRCQCQHHSAALLSFGHGPAGTRTLVRQLLQLLRAGPDSGGPYTAPAPLLQAMLNRASAGGDADTIRGLMALPQPPDINSDEGKALTAALVHAPRLDVLTTLLDSGSNPCANPSMVVFRFAAHAPSQLPPAALPLLLRHCRAVDLPAAQSAALGAAVSCDNAAAAATLLPALFAIEEDVLEWAWRAADGGSPAVLTLLIEHHSPHLAHLNKCLLCAACRGHAACVAVLLDRGAEVNYRGSRALLWAVGSGREAVVRLLMQRGAEVTADVLAEAGKWGRADMLALLQPDVVYHDDEVDEDLETALTALNILDPEHVHASSK